MARREFPTAVRVAVIKRCARDGLIYCEKCHALAKRFQIDHVNPDGLTGKPVLSNAMLLCEPCFSIKNPQDASNIAKAKRREAIDLGGKKPSAKKIESPGFTPGKRRTANPMPTPPRARSLYEDRSETNG